MKAIRFDLSYPRMAVAYTLGAFSPAGYLSRLGPVTYREVPDPVLFGQDWVILKVRYAGICGSDVMQVFLKGDFDNPITALISFPHVLGHEVVGTVIETGRDVTKVKKGDRVVFYAWLTCTVRGLAPCGACRQGDLTLCENLTAGRFAPGMHAGNCRDVPGGFAPYLAAHQSMCFPIPESVPFETAALCDPFSVCLRAVGKAPPKAGETVLVFGVGTLGLLLVHLISRLYPGVRVVGLDLRDDVEGLAKRMGAEVFIAGAGAEVVAKVGELTGTKMYRPWGGLPFLQGGVDRVYDAVGDPRSLELAARITRPKGTIVIVGVAPPGRFEWTPIYLKELQIIGSNGCSVEDFQGQRRHGFDIYLDLLAQGRVDTSPMITHKVGLADYQRGFLAAKLKPKYRSVKVLFDLEGRR